MLEDNGADTVIWNRGEALLHPSIIIHPVVNGDITDDLTIVVSRDFGPGLCCYARTLLLGVISVGASAVHSYDGTRTYIELVERVSGSCALFSIC